MASLGILREGCCYPKGVGDEPDREIVAHRVDG